MADETKAAPAEEVVKNCPACKKPLKKARRYYRNGAYYCNNTCFRKVQADNAAKAAEAGAKEAEAGAEEKA